MQIADITIISRGEFPEVIEKPNKSTINLLSILLNSRYFNDFVTSFIDKYAIEQEDNKPNLSKVTDDLKNCYKYPEIGTVVDVLGLSSDFIPDFYLLAKYNAFRDQVLQQQNITSDANSLKFSEYFKQVILNGTDEEKQEVLKCIQQTLYLHNGDIIANPLI